MGEDVLKARKRREDIEEFKEFMEVIRREVPGLMREVFQPLLEFLNVFLSPEAARERARAIGESYKELVQAGIPEEEALEIAKSQVIDVRTIFQSVLEEIVSMKGFESRKAWSRRWDIGEEEREAGED